MAEINAASSGQRPGVRRGKKLSTRVDLTPMVDLGFLLITFFIFTTTMSLPKALELNMPVDDPTIFTNYPESKTLTVIPLAGDQVFYYHGKLEEAILNNQFNVCGYDLQSGIGSVIRKKQNALDLRGVGRKEMALIIKPGPSSSYKNTTDMLDEILINEIEYYSLADLQEDEKSVLRSKGIEF